MEAALIVPLVLFVLLFLMNQGITLYEETVKISERQNIWDTYQPAERFRVIEGVRKAAEKNQEGSQWK